MIFKYQITLKAYGSYLTSPLAVFVELLCNINSLPKVMIDMAAYYCQSAASVIRIFPIESLNLPP